MTTIDGQRMLVSPWLAALEAELRAGTQGALDALWAELANHDRGAVLIEAHEDDPEHVLLTFLWQAEVELRGAVLVGDALGADHAGNRMSRLLDTNVWYRTYRTRSTDLPRYSLSRYQGSTAQAIGDGWEERVVDWDAEPLDACSYFSYEGQDAPEYEVTGVALSVVELPAPPPDSPLAPHAESSSGRVEQFRLWSEILGNERDVWVYTPPGYSPAQGPYGVMVQFDGETYTHLVGVPTILDNLISEGRIPPLVAVLPDNIDHETRMRELGCHQPFVDYLTEELLPWARERYAVGDDPERTVVSGSSMGGLAALYVGLRASDVFGAVLSQSGSFWWRPNDEEPHEWLNRRYAESPRLPLRLYLDVGIFETSITPGDGPTQVEVNRRMRDVLCEKGYDVTYAEFEGGHYWGCWKGTLADGLVALLGQRLA